MSRYAARKLVLVLSVVVAAAPSIVQAQAPKIDPSWPDWLKEAMAAELEELRFEPVSLGPIATVMPGKIKEQSETAPGRYYASADDGSGALFECWFYSDAIDIASSAVSIADAVVEAMSEQYGPVGFRSIHHVDAGEIDGSSFLALEWMYAVGEAPEALAALTKVRAAERDGVSVICAHSLPGYRQSFADGFAEIVRRLDADSDVASPYYQETHLFSLNELNVGYATVTMTRDEDGDTRIVAKDAMLIPVSSSDLFSSEGTAVSWSTPDGYLINALQSGVENGELTMDLSLRLDDSDMWVVEGSFRGKAINAELGQDARPASTLGEMLGVRHLLAEPETLSVDLLSWVPDADPTKFTDFTVALDPEADAPGAASIILGPLKIYGEFDENGSMRRGSMDMGGVNMLIERAFSSGQLR
jgi:hypothetical protein